LKQSLKSLKKIRLAPENECRESGYDIVIGIDEAGRGPLAGPVVAGAVALADFNVTDDKFRRLLEQVADSKKLSAAARGEIYNLLVSHKSIVWGSGQVEPKVIDKINILEATKRAMEAAVSDLLAKMLPALNSKIFCLLDGNFKINIDHEQKSIIKGDQKVFSISAASIIAKVARDRLMVDLGKRHPEYGFCRHKGYPTREHIRALGRFGLLPEHRKSFGPCAVLLEKAIIKI